MTACQDDFSFSIVVEAVTGSTPSRKRSGQKYLEFYQIHKQLFCLLSSSRSTKTAENTTQQDQLLEKILMKIFGWEMQLTKITKYQEDQNIPIKLLGDKLSSIENIIDDIGSNMSSSSGAEKVSKKILIELLV